MSDDVRYTLAELRDFRDTLDDILYHLEAHPYVDGGREGGFEGKTQLRPTGFTMHVKFGKGVDMPVLPRNGETRSTRNLVDLGFRPFLTSQLLNQLIETLERPL